MPAGGIRCNGRSSRDRASTPRVNFLIDDVEDATGEDLGGAQDFVNWLIDRAQDRVRPVFDALPDPLPCMDPNGPHCW